jgi:hypothetical protein
MVALLSAACTSGPIGPVLLTNASPRNSPSPSSKPSGDPLVWPQTNRPTQTFGSPQSAANALMAAWRRGDRDAALRMAPLPAAVSIFYLCTGRERRPCLLATFDAQSCPTFKNFARCTFGTNVGGLNFDIVVALNLTTDNRFQVAQIESAGFEE